MNLPKSGHMHFSLICFKIFNQILIFFCIIAFGSCIDIFSHNVIVVTDFYTICFATAVQHPLSIFHDQCKTKISRMIADISFICIGWKLPRVTVAEFNSLLPKTFKDAPAVAVDRKYFLVQIRDVKENVLFQILVQLILVQKILLL